MYKKRILLGTFFFIFLFFLMACSSDNEGLWDDHNNENGEINLANGESPTRKIIYKAQLSIYTTQFDETIEFVRELIESDEWFDSETVSERSATFYLRIKTERLDTVLNNIRANHQVNNYSKVATDVSLAYQDASDKITALQLQQARLLVLYENATLSEMLTINSQLSSIEVQLAQLQGTLNQFDSLVDYSEVRINVYSSAVAGRSPFLNRIGHAFENGYLAVFAILDGLVIAIVTLTPIAIVFVPAGYGVFRLYKYVEKRRKSKKPLE